MQKIHDMKYIRFYPKIPDKIAEDKILLNIVIEFKQKIP